MERNSVISLLAGALAAEQNCIKNDNKEWRAKHQALAQLLIDKCLPSGSGFDNGTTLGTVALPRKIELGTAYHHMDDNGTYIGWTYHRVIVTADLTGLNVQVTGENRRDIKSVIQDRYYEALTLVLSEGAVEGLRDQAYDRVPV